MRAQPRRLPGSLLAAVVVLSVFSSYLTTACSDAKIADKPTADAAAYAMRWSTA